MAKKKTLLVETHKAGAAWSIKVSGGGEDLFQLFGSMVRQFAGEIPIVNATDPFPPPGRKRKKNKVPVGDKKAAIAALQDLKEAVIKS